MTTMPDRQAGPAAEQDRITVRDVYDAQQRTDGKIDAISVQVATFTARVEVRLDHGQAQLNDHEKRIRVLEAFKWKLAGASLVLGAIAGSAASWVGLLISHHLEREMRQRFPPGPDHPVNQHAQMPDDMQHRSFTSPRLLLRAKVPG